MGTMERVRDLAYMNYDILKVISKYEELKKLSLVPVDPELNISGHQA